MAGGELVAEIEFRVALAPAEGRAVLVWNPAARTASSIPASSMKSGQCDSRLADGKARKALAFDDQHVVATAEQRASDCAGRAGSDDHDFTVLRLKRRHTASLPVVVGLVDGWPGPEKLNARPRLTVRPKLLPPACWTPPAGRTTASGGGRQQGADRADRGAADLLAHQNGVIHADRRDQQQAEQAKQRQRLTEPAETGQARRAARGHGQSSAGRRPGEGKAEQGKISRLASSEFAGLKLGRGKQLVEAGRLIDQCRAGHVFSDVFRATPSRKPCRLISPATPSFCAPSQSARRARPTGLSAPPRWSPVAVPAGARARPAGCSSRHRGRRAAGWLGAVAAGRAQAVLFGSRCNQLAQGKVPAQALLGLQAGQAAAELGLAFEQRVGIGGAHEDWLVGWKPVIVPIRSACCCSTGARLTHWRRSSSNDSCSTPLTQNSPNTASSRASRCVQAGLGAPAASAAPNPMGVARLQTTIEQQRQQAGGAEEGAEQSG